MGKTPAQRSDFRPRCPKCGSYSIGYQSDASWKEKYVVCLTCSHRIYSDKIDEVFSEQLNRWNEGKGLSCLHDGCEEPRRDGHRTCSPMCDRAISVSDRKKARLSDF